MTLQEKLTKWANETAAVYIASEDILPHRGVSLCCIMLGTTNELTM